MDTEPRISALVGLLRSEKSDPTTLARQFAATLPGIHNPLNLRLVLQEAAQAPTLFRTVNDTLYLVDAIAAATLRKRQISNPTILYPDFVRAVTTFASQLPVLPGLVVLTGLNVEANDRYAARALVHFFKYSVRVPLDPRIVAAVMAKAHYSLDVARLPLNFYWPAVLSLLWPFKEANFGPYSSLAGHCLNRMAGVKSVQTDYFSATEQAVVAATLEYTQSEPLAKYKTLLFGLTLQFEGLCNRLLHDPRDAPDICTNMLRILHNLGFVASQVNFDTYQYVYHLCIDVLMESPTAAINACILQLASQLNAASQPVGEGKLLFFMATVQQLLPRAPRATLETAVLPVIRAHLASPERAVLDASHSFMLEYLQIVLSANARGETVRDDAVLFFDELLQLFPREISFEQVKSALGSITAVLGHPLEHETHVREYILGRLFELVKRTQPGTEFDKGPPTMRSCFVVLLLRAVSDLCSQRELAVWLDRLSGMIPQAYSDLTLRERKYIKAQILEVVGDLSLGLADVGINYWFAEGARI